jgi:hypothetical protein
MNRIAPRPRRVLVSRMVYPARIYGPPRTGHPRTAAGKKRAHYKRFKNKRCGRCWPCASACGVCKKCVHSRRPLRPRLVVQQPAVVAAVYAAPHNAPPPALHADDEDVKPDPASLPPLRLVTIHSASDIVITSVRSVKREAC